MKVKKLFHVMGFLLVFTALLCLVDTVTGKNVYDNTVWKKIQNEDMDVDILIMGNSHAYTSVDTPVLSACMNQEADVLGSGGQNMEDTLEALKIALSYQKPDVILLDVYSVCVDSRDELQNEKRGMLYNNLDGVNNYLQKAGGVLHTFKWNNFLDGTFQVFRPTSIWERWDFSTRERKDMHGFVAKDSYAYGECDLNDYAKEVRRIYGQNETESLTEYNQKSLQEFLRLTAESDIPVMLYNIPTLSPSVSKKVNAVFQLASDTENVVFMKDFGLDIKTIGLEAGDFYDTSHLNRRGAEKFTQYFSGFLAEVLHFEENWKRVFAYKSEQHTCTEDGTCLYTMENYCSDTLYQFRLIVNGETVEKQDYSMDHTFTSDCDIRLTDQDTQLWCYMIPVSDAEMGDKSPSRISVKFMKQNDCCVTEQGDEERERN